MGRAWQIEYEGGLYHVLSRGNEMSGKIFFMMTGIAWFIHYARCDPYVAQTRPVNLCRIEKRRNNFEKIK